MRKLGLELKALINLIVRTAHKSQDENKLSIPHMGVLRYIIDHDEKDINQKDLEEVFMIRKSTCSRILKLMEDNDLITRMNDLTDHRKKIIKITDKSRKLFVSLESKYEDFEREIVDNIDKEDLDTFFKVLDKVKANLIAKQEDEENYD